MHLTVRLGQSIFIHGMLFFICFMDLVWIDKGYLIVLHIFPVGPTNQLSQDLVPWGIVSLGLMIGGRVIAEVKKPRFKAGEARHSRERIGVVELFCSSVFLVWRLRTALDRPLYQLGGRAGYLASTGTQMFLSGKKHYER